METETGIEIEAEKETEIETEAEIKIEIEGLILAGGKSRRMDGFHKGDLLWQKRTFMERIIEEFQKETSQIWISYGSDVWKTYPGCRIVRDEYPGCGPISGLHAGLKRCKSELVMVSACDMPFIRIELYRFLRRCLFRAMEEHPDICWQGAVPVVGGRIHPLAAVYKKGLAEGLEEQIRKGCYRLQDVLAGQKLLYVELDSRPEYAAMLRNINTTEEYKSLIK